MIADDVSRSFLHNLDKFRLDQRKGFFDLCLCYLEICCGNVVFIKFVCQLK